MEAAQNTDVFSSEHQNEKTGNDDIQTLTNSDKISAVDASADIADASQPFNEQDILTNLGATVRDQDDLERDITHQAQLALVDAEDTKDKNRIVKAEAKKLRLQSQKDEQRKKLHSAQGNPSLKDRIQREIARIDAETKLIDDDIDDYNRRIEDRHQVNTDDNVTVAPAKGRMPNESHRDYLIRTGKITPFAKIGGKRPEGADGVLAEALLDAEDEAIAQEIENAEPEDQIRSHQNLRAPGFAEDADDATSIAVESEFSLRPRKKRKVQSNSASDDDFEPATTASPESTPDDVSEDEYDMTRLTQPATSKKRKGKKRYKTAGDANTEEDSDEVIDLRKIDDGDESVYQERLADWVERRSRARRRKRERDGLPVDDDDETEEWLKPSPDQADHDLGNGLKLPADIYPSLFDYQKTGVAWLAELYNQAVGGILGDEMGLGKTVQVISFIAALHHSGMLNKPVLIVAPATVLQQWVEEFHRWWPALRVSILHTSGSGMLNTKTERFREEDATFRRHQEIWTEPPEERQSSSSARAIVKRVLKHGHVLVTTYAGLSTYNDIVIPVEWDYVVLDEGHKIRNPNAEVTVLCKELLSANRIILSGTPMQNNLTELWSLFDFINPMQLGTLVIFRKDFDIPIRQGGYANATSTDIMTAEKCAETLKDAISPYLLMRSKRDVATDLPGKSEQVLFCKLTREQRYCYEKFLKSEEMGAIMTKRRNCLYGIDYLRKVCNHPDLVSSDPGLSVASWKRKNFGLSHRSSKMLVVESLVQMWKGLGHKTLIFCQTTQMLNILQLSLERLGTIKFFRMDGTTAIPERQGMVDRFNNDPDTHVFLLTTKVGGLGINLTGASRVIIFDPDWNPSTDIQARERAWRLGQKKEVVIFRLVTQGTIEEKIYQRQIYKQFLSNKVLHNASQKASLNMSDLADLFSLSPESCDSTETGRLFADSKTDMGPGPQPKITPGGGLYQLPDERAQMATLKHQGQKEENNRINTIANVARLMEYETEGGDNDEDDKESRIMKGLFSRGVVQESLEHDQIVNGKKVVKAAQAAVMREANRVSAEAAESLRRSREEARTVPIGTVTWTGERGNAGRPVNSRVARSAADSVNLLSNVRGRQPFVMGEGQRNNRTDRTAIDAQVRRRMRTYTVKDFKEMIPDFIRRQGGQVPTKMLVDHFDKYCRDDSQRSTDNFKTALNTVAEMDSSGGRFRRTWHLLPEYK